MRILLLNNSARPFNGGANRVVVETCGFLTDRGHDVLLAYYDEGPVEVRCPVESIPDSGRPGDLAALVRRWKPDVVQVHFVRREDALEEVASVAPTTIFLHDQTWFCSSGDRMRRDLTPCHRPHGVSCLFWHYAQGCGRKSPWGNWLFWKRTRQLYRRTRALGSVRLQVASRFMRQGLLENGHEDSRIDLVPLYAPDPGPPSSPAGNGLLFLPSRLVPPKGVQVAIEAFARLDRPGWSLIIAGEGWHRRALEQQAARLGVGPRVRFVGEIPPAEVDEWYRRCEIVLVPVLRPEPFGLVGVEALAHGRPVVAFGGGGSEEWLSPESAVKVGERTPAAYADALGALIDSPERRGRLAEGARRRYAPFHPDAYIRRLLESFGKAAAAGRLTSPSS